MDIKICFCIGCIDNNGGSERVTSILTDHLAKEGYKISILSYESQKQIPYYDINGLIHIYYLYKDTIKLPRQYLNLIYKLRRFFMQNKFDIVVAVDVSQIIFLFWALGGNTKLIVWEQFNYTRSYESKLQFIARKIACIYSNAVVTLTDEDAVCYKKNVHRNVIVRRIYNYIPQMPRDTALLTKKDKKMIILSVGRLAYQKGFDMLIDVAHRLREKRNDWKWIIVGEGPERELLEKKIYEMKLEKYIKLAGAKKDVYNFYKMADIFVVTSRYEGFGLVIVEAQSFNLPIVSFNCKMGPSELIEDGINGYLIPCFDLQLMQDKIETLMNSSKLREEKGSMAKINFWKFRSKDITNQWIKLLKEVENEI